MLSTFQALPGPVARVARLTWGCALAVAGIRSREWWGLGRDFKESPRGRRLMVTVALGRLRSPRPEGWALFHGIEKEPCDVTNFCCHLRGHVEDGGKGLTKKGVGKKKTTRTAGDAPRHILLLPDCHSHLIKEQSRKVQQPTRRQIPSYLLLDLHACCISTTEDRSRRHLMQAISLPPKKH